MLKKYNNIKILYVEDDDIARENGVEYLENYFDTIYEASNASIAFQIYEKYRPEIIITDIQMPKINGLEFVKRVRKIDKKTQIIVITAFCNKEYLLQAVELQLVKYLIKPINETDFKEAIFISIETKSVIEALIINDISNIFKFDDNSYFDTFNKVLIVENNIVKLRAKEILFLELLIKNKNRYVSYEEIESYVWFDNIMTKDALKTLVKNLKTKLPKNIGYKIGC